MQRQPIHRGTNELAAATSARADAYAQVEQLLAAATGTAHDADRTVQVTVDARGGLLELWLAPETVRQDPQQLGTLLVETARTAMQEAIQDGYNRVALRLGEDTTYLIEQLTGLPAPARADEDGGGITVEEFQRRRAERLRAHGDSATPQQARTVAWTPGAAANDPSADDELATFDPASLRSGG